jgi:sugar phosphate isomerase/epimerase/pimeloyl-ACP methyl ester carboxylesterase
VEIGVFARTFDRGNLARSLDAALAHNFRLVHFNFRVAGGETLPLELDDHVCTKIRREFESRGVRMAGVSATYNLIHPDRVYRVEQTRRACRLIELARTLGTTTVTLSTGTRDPNDIWKSHPGNDKADAWTEMRSTLEELLTAAETSDVTLGIEPEPGNIVSSAKRARRLLDEVESPHLGIILDPVNISAQARIDYKAPLEEALELLADRIRAVHAKDIIRRTDANLDWDQIIHLLSRHGVVAPILIHDVAENDVDQARAFLSQTLTQLETSTSFERDGIAFRYESAGEGEAVVLLHGLGGDRRQALELVPSECGTRIALDLRAHGDTRPVGRTDAFTFATFAEDVLALAQTLGIERMSLVGVSMGAGVALRFALDNPDRVRALVLVRPAWVEQPLTENLIPFVDIARLLTRFGVEQGRRAFENSDRLRTIRKVSAYAADSLCAQFAKPHATERAVRLERMPASIPYSNLVELQQLDVPALVIGSTQDPVHPLEFAERWAETLGRGHMTRAVSTAVSKVEHDRAIRKAAGEFLDEPTGYQAFVE